MIEKQINITYKIAQSIVEFDTAHQKLIKSTIAFAAQAYAPYSNFRVSAALILENGELLKGTNVENASYPVSICAERTLVSHAVSNYPNIKIKTIAVYVDKTMTTPLPPCGLCRHTLLEVEQRQQSPIQLLLIANENQIYIFEKCGDLLPLAFDGNFL